MATPIPSKCAQALAGISSKLLELQSWDRWEKMPFDVITVDNYGGGKPTETGNKNYTQRIEALTQAAGGKFAMLLQALPSPEIKPDASGPVLIYSFQIDLYHRLMFPLDATKAMELVAKWLNEFTPVDNRTCRKLWLKSVSGGETTDKTFYVHKLTFTWEAPI